MSFCNIFAKFSCPNKPNFATKSNYLGEVTYEILVVTISDVKHDDHWNKMKLGCRVVTTNCWKNK